MSVRLFVGNLSYEVTEADLRALFSEVGTVTVVRVPVDRETGRPRGFAFVDFAERAQGEEAIRRFHQQTFKGRPLAVSEAVAREDAPRAPSRPMGGGMPMGAPAPRMGGAPGGPPAAKNFGPDALPRNKRRPEGGRGAGGGERGPKGPIKESGGGRAFGGGLADDEADTGDEVPFWAVNDDKSQDDE